MRWWKMLGTAGFAVIAAAGVAAVRHRLRFGSAEEIRAQWHARFEEAARAARERAAARAARERGAPLPCDGRRPRTPGSPEGARL
ncbi:hypothetical protein [Thermostaphylospora chromogena]|uniref:Uncharacterized protein n=1 Tax=Thermostaphylospora chromogena TaxID=35622 RepID=A0A1H1F0E8_9ACTN|nr:hypothetical protein [Thermostaphylospora chromogena]SDQ93886.1 hypothetical protein SAMN04489764_2697 [Thermostaphylospora chromogena]